MQIRVYKGQYGWSLLCKNHTKEGKNIKMYINVRFVKCKEPMLDKADIVIKNGWHSCYEDKAGFVHPELVVMDYEEVVRDEQKEFQSENAMQLNIDADDLPFY